MSSSLKVSKADKVWKKFEIHFNKCSIDKLKSLKKHITGKEARELLEKTLKKKQSKLWKAINEQEIQREDY